MYKLLLILALVFLTTCCFSQSFNIGLKAGVNLSTVAFNSTYPNLAVQEKNKTGFQAGIVTSIGFQHFSVEPGLFFITMGQKFNEEVTFSSGNQVYSYHQIATEKFNYLQLPVNILYKIELPHGAKIRAGGGPYLGYGLSGSISAHLTGSQNTDYTGSVSFGNKTTDVYKHFDYGVNLIAGVELRKYFTIDLNYGLGLKNIDWSTSNDTKNRSIGLSVGYFFKQEYY